MTIKLHKSQKIQVINTFELAAVMHQILKRENKIDRSKEHLWLVSLDASNRIQLIELISLGSGVQTIADPIEIFSFALQKQARKIVLVHNHPTGVLTPSAADKNTTLRMMAIGEFVNIPVIDHLIIGETGYRSFVTSGLYAELNKIKPDLTFREIDRMKKEVEALKIKMKNREKKTREKVRNAEIKAKATKKEMQKKITAMVQKALLKGIPLKQVAEISGLNVNQVKRIARD